MKFNLVHKQVMIEEAMDYLNLREGFTYVDATFGDGSYSQEILSRFGCNVIAIDKDPEVMKRASSINEKFNGKFKFVLGSFGDLDIILKKLRVNHINGGIVFDLGVSSMQLKDPGRGFSFNKNGPLDMRMSKNGVSAADIINTYSVEKIHKILKEYGEERRSRAIAKLINKERIKTKILNTHDLVKIVKKVVPISKRDNKNPATSTFQALRIVVNNEVNELKKALLVSEKILSPGGRLIVVSFHSIEDRIVKNFINEKSGIKSNSNRHLPELKKVIPTFKSLSKKAIKVTSMESSLNRSARSAKLRAAEKLDNKVEAA